MPTDIVDLLSSSPTPPEVNANSGESSCQPVAAKKKVKRDDIDDVQSSWPSSDPSNLQLTRNLDLDIERSPKRRKVQSQVFTTTSPRVKRTSSLNAAFGRANPRQTRRPLGEVEELSDSDPFVSSPREWQPKPEDPPAVNILPKVRAAEDLAARPNPANAAADWTTTTYPEEDGLDPIVLSSPGVCSTMGRAVPGPLKTQRNSSKAAKRSAEALSSPLLPSNELPAIKMAPRQPTARTIRASKSLDPFSSSPQPKNRNRSPSKETTKVDICTISSSPRSATHIQPSPKNLDSTEIISSDPFASSPTGNRSQKAIASSKPQHSKASAHGRLKSRHPHDLDPISSSAPEAANTPGQPQGLVIAVAESDTQPEDSSGDDLPSIDDLRQLQTRASTSIRRVLSDSYATSRKTTQQTTTTRTNSTVKPKVSAEDKERAKSEKQRAREAEKEARKLAAEQKKNVQALEKAKSAALAEVNKIKTDKKNTTREMIVDLPSGLNESLRISVQTVLESLEPAPRYTMYESVIANAVKFRRKVNSRYDEGLGYWVPCPANIQDEAHVLIVIDAEEFVQLAQQGLNDFVGRVEATFPNATKVYLLQGILTWKKKNRTLKNRQFASGVRGEDTEPSTNRRRRVPPKEPVDEDLVEDAMLQLQVQHDALIHHTTTPPDTASWISTFTQHISTIPYRHRRDLDLRAAGFCMESGQVKTGENPRDTYVKMLGEIGRVTDGIAYGVAEEFPSVGKLVRGLEGGGQEVLEGVKKASNRNGAFSDRTIGVAMSRRFHKIFTGRDEDSTDV